MHRQAAASNEVLQENHYYPGAYPERSRRGLSTNGAWMNNAALDNLYQYTCPERSRRACPERSRRDGKELNADWGLNMLDYGARMYMADVGRWNGVDALADSFLSVSPYVYVLNNPVLLIDPNGKVVRIYGSSEENSKFTRQLQEAFGGKVEASINEKTGELSLIRKDGELTENESVALKYLNIVIDSDKSVEITLTNHEEERSGTITFGDFEAQAIDVDDMDALGNDPNRLNVLGVVVHEVMEQFIKVGQGDNPNYLSAHGQARNFENNVQNADHFSEQFLRVEEGGKMNTYKIEIVKNQSNNVTSVNYTLQP